MEDASRVGKAQAIQVVCDDSQFHGLPLVPSTEGR
jgi:hypothetical protein